MPGYFSKYVRMNSAASSRDILSRAERPYSLRPYRTPKLKTLARRRIAAVTSASDTPNTWEAGDRPRLVELGVQAVGVWVDQRGQGVQVGGLQLGQLAV